VGQKAQPHDTSKQPQPEPQPPSPGTKTYSQKPSTAASNHQPTQPAAAVNAATIKMKNHFIHDLYSIES